MEDPKDRIEDTENLEQQRSRERARKVERNLDREPDGARTLDPSPSQRTVQPSDRTRRTE